MANYELDEIHRIRREISERFNHDVRKLGEYYMELDKNTGSLANTNSWSHRLRSLKKRRNRKRRSCGLTPDS